MHVLPNCCLQAYQSCGDPADTAGEMILRLYGKQGAKQGALLQRKDRMTRGHMNMPTELDTKPGG
jgi:hypothetical protein